jgi:PAS domain S-box-containing protein
VGDCTPGADVWHARAEGVTDVRRTHWLPQGARLSADEWRTRHRLVTTVAALHVPLLWAYGLWSGHGVLRSTLEILAVVVVLGVAMRGRSRRACSLAASTALLLCSAAVVHLSDGLVEAHFHYFVAVALIALYEEWLVYAVAVGFVVLQHGVMGSLYPESVFGHHDGSAWLWTAVHTGFIVALCAAQLAFWRASDRAHARRLAAERAQQGTSRRAQQVVEDSPVGIAHLSLTGEYVEVNPAYCDLLGREAAQIIGHRADEFTHPEDIAGNHHVIGRLLDDRRTLQHEKRYVRPDGTEVWGLVTVSVLADDRGRPAWLLSQAQDVTEGRRVRETRLHLALEAAGTGSWEWDLVEGTVDRSVTAARLLGLEADPSGPAYAQIHPDDRDCVTVAQERAIRGDGRFDVEYRVPQPDGSVRWVLSRAELLRDADGRPVRFIGVSLDVTDRHRADEERAALLEGRQRAAERAIRLQRLTAALAEALAVDEIRAALDDTAADMPGTPRSLLHVFDTERASWADGGDEQSDVLREALRARQPLWRPDPGSGGSVKAVPLVSRGVLHGGWELRWGAGDALTPEDLRFLRTAGTLVAATLERAALFEQQREVAELLQRSLLPDRIAQPPGVVTAARYLPAGEAAQVGGDWYDVIPLPDGRIGVAIGDVSGHGIRAAALMGQLRGTLRAYALEGHSPGRVLAALNRAAVAFTGLTPEQLATVAYAVVDPHGGRMRHARAGHPPLVLVDEVPDGWEPRLLDGPAGLPLGVDEQARYAESSADLGVGSWLLGYTDGFVERRDESIDAGLERMLSAIRGTSALALDEVLEELLHTVPGGTGDDDIALIALRPELVPATTLPHLPHPRRSLGD